MLRMFGATLALSLQEIQRHILRSFLTTLGIIIGVAAVITMVTLGNGLTASVQEDISDLGSDVLIVFPIADDQGVQRPFRQEDVDLITRQIAGVEGAAGSANAVATAFFNGQDWPTSVQGANMPFFEAQAIDIAEGRGFNAEEEEAGRSVCVLGPTIVDEIFIVGESPIGQTMRVGNVACTVVGVTDERSSAAGAGGSNDANDVVLMPLKTVQRRFTGNSDLQFVVIQYDPAYSSDWIVEQLRALLRERRVLQAGESDDFNIIDTAEINETISTVTGTMTAVVGAIAAISLLVGGIGIMNIMLVSVTERTREIGIRLAIGALGREVRMQFLTEAVVLCCLGGVVGILLALGLSIGLSNLLDMPFVFDPFVNVVSFVFSAIMGIAFGYYPAHRASQLDPIEALRHE